MFSRTNSRTGEMRAVFGNPLLLHFDEKSGSLFHKRRLSGLKRGETVVPSYDHHPILTQPPREKKMRSGEWKLLRECKFIRNPPPPVLRMLTHPSRSTIANLPASLFLPLRWTPAHHDKQLRLCKMQLQYVAIPGCTPCMLDNCILH